MFGKILIATDGSDTGDRALDCAAELSAKLGRDLMIVHVLMHGQPAENLARLAEVEHLVEPTPPRDKSDGLGLAASLSDHLASMETTTVTDRAVAAIGEVILDRAKRRAVKAGARHVTVRTCRGDYANQILSTAKAEAAGMIVIGRRGLGRLREALVGSVSQKVLHHAPCIVSIVP